MTDTNKPKKQKLTKTQRRARKTQSYSERFANWLGRQTDDDDTAPSPAYADPTEY